jgi:hypothetical protein
MSLWAYGARFADKTLDLASPFAGVVWNPNGDRIRTPALFQGRKRLNNVGLMVMKAAPQRERRRENRQNGDQTHTHTSPLRTRYALQD